MLVSKFLERLAKGPVGDLAIGGEQTGVIPSGQVSRMLDFAQEALTAVYGRFPLSTKTITLQTIDGRYLYPLLTKHAQSSLEEPMADKFIVDSVSAPFIGDVLMVEHILDSSRNELGLDDRGDATSWFTVAYDTLSMDYPVSGQTYFLQYRANHPALIMDVGTFGTQEIRLPSTLEAAFLARVAYEVFCTQTGETAAIKAQEQLGKYEALCQELEARNVLKNSVTEDRACRIRQAGWP